MDSEKFTLTKILSMFPYSRYIHIIDTQRNDYTIFCGMIRDMDNGDHTVIDLVNFIPNAFDVVNDFFIIYGYYKNNNEE